MINLNGYYVNRRYPNVVTLIQELMNSAVVAQTQSEAKTILRLLQRLGAIHLVYDAPVSDHLELNVPHRGAKDHLYQLGVYKGELVGIVTPYSQRNVALGVRPVLRVGDIVVRKSLGATVRDLF